MGVYIRGMEMPQNCAECFFHKVFPTTGVGINQLYCALCGINIVKLSDAQPDCPLVPVPPHGDLIDRDPFIDFIKTHWDSYDQWFVDQLEARPTIIEAEEGEG